MEMFTRLILYIQSLIKLIKIHIINLFDLQSSPVNENNDYFQIWGHIKRVYNNRSDDAKKKNSREQVALLNTVLVMFAMQICRGSAILHGVSISYKVIPVKHTKLQ